MQTLRSLLETAALTVALIAFGGAWGRALHAQSEAPPASHSVTVGPYFAGGATVHIKPVRGEHVEPVFAYRTGAAITFPLTSALSATLDLGYDSRGVHRKSIDDSFIYTTTRVGYIAFTPGFSLKAFWLGLNLGVPINAATRWRDGATAKELEGDLVDDEFDKIEYLVEPRIGATVPIIDDDNGLLALTISAGFTLNQLALGEGVPVEESHLLGNYQMVSGHFGLTYQFIIPETSR